MSLRGHFRRGGRRRALLACALACLCAGPLAGSAAGEPSWPTYHRDSTRSGADPDATEPIAPTLAWQSANLGAPIWSQPLIVGPRAYVATVGDKVYALDVGSGAVIWATSIGTPVPASALPCGDVEPTVGIVGTPVIDVARSELFAVADTWDGSTPHHELVGLSLSSGAIITRTPVDPPGADPKAILQRTALNLDGGRVVFGFGGNNGDCSDYFGWVVAAPEEGGGALYWHPPVSAPSQSGGAVWAPSGPAVGPEGDVYATTGNPVPPAGMQPGAYDYTDSVVQLGPTLNLIGSFEPPNWKEEGENDLDLSSAGAELLPGGLLFQAGKDGRGYLIDESTMGFSELGKPGAPAVFEGPTCGGQGSFGGDAYASGVIYVACKGGTQALAYNQGARTFTPMWKGPGDAFGPPILSGGSVWVVATGSFGGGGTTLYGLDPATGAPRYTLTLPSPVADHFASPSAAGGRVFVATGSTESAYVITRSPSPGVASPLTTAGTLSKGSPVPTLVHTHLRADKRGRIRITLRCTLLHGKCTGTLTLRAKLRGTRRVRGRRVPTIRYVTLAKAGFKRGKGTWVLTVRLGPRGRALLSSHHRRLALQVVIAVPHHKARKLNATLTQAR